MRIPNWQRARGLRPNQKNAESENPNAVTIQSYRMRNFNAGAQTARQLSMSGWAAIRWILSVALGLAMLLVLQPAWGQEFTIESSTLESFDGIAEGGEFTLTGTVASVEPGLVSGGEFVLEAEIAVLTPEPSPPSPTISISTVGSQVVVEWPVSAGDFILDETAELSATANWTPVTTPYTTNATHISVTLSAADGTRFFRLRKPVP
jgi:hypothetical protein